MVAGGWLVSCSCVHKWSHCNVNSITQTKSFGMLSSDPVSLLGIFPGAASNPHDSSSCVPDIFF